MKSLKDKFKQEVRKNLVIYGKRKREILFDLDEIFEQAKELGESEETLISRLGSGKEYAYAIQRELGIDADAKKRTQTIIAIITVLAIFAIALTLCLVIKGGMPPSDSIGFADGSTQIEIVGACVGLYGIFMAIGALCVAFGLLLIIRLIGLRGGKNVE